MALLYDAGAHSVGIHDMQRGCREGSAMPGQQKSTLALTLSRVLCSMRNMEHDFVQNRTGIY